MPEQNIDSTNKTAEENNVQKIYSAIQARNTFYRVNLRFLLGIYLLGIIAIVMMLIVYYRASTDAKSTWYIPTNLDGTVIKKEDLLTPVSDGFRITDDYVINWVQNSIQVIYDFDFSGQAASYRNMINLFTPDGFIAYARALETESRLFQSISATKLVVQAHGCGNQTTRVEYKGIQDVQGYSVYTWRLSMPIIAVIASAKTTPSVMRGDLRVEIQRVPKLLSKTGIAVYGFIIYNQKQYETGTTDPQKLCEALGGV